MRKAYKVLLGAFLVWNVSQAQDQPLAVYTGANASTLFENAMELHIRPGIQSPGYIEFQPGTGIRSADFFTAYSRRLQLRAEDEFRLSRSESDQTGYLISRYSQYYKGIRVEGGEYILAEKNGEISSLSGYYFKGLSIDPSGPISKSSALEAARTGIGAKVYKWEVPDEEKFIKASEQNPNATYNPLPSAELVIAPVAGDYRLGFRLAYKLDVYAHVPLSRHYVYVDALSGKVINMISRIMDSNVTGTANTRYNGTQSITADSYNGSYRLRTDVALSTGRKMETYNMNNGTNYSTATEFTDADNNWTADPVAYSCHWGAEATYDYYSTKYSRNSFDNAGAVIKSYVHYSTNYVNAMWDGTKMTYGDGDNSSYSPLTSLDVCGHEISHAVTQYTSNLAYQNESGALNESFSDIFGTAIEFYKEGAAGDWLIGEDFDMTNHTGFRSMSNPNSKSQPDTYNGTYWQATSAFPSQLDDQGGVHTNSGVQNYWFYLLSVGASGTNDNNNSFSVTGIGVDKAAAIAYRNNVYKLTSSATYADARTGAIAAARDLYGTGSQEEISVTNAWYAVGVGAAYVGGGTGCNVPAGLAASNVTSSSATLSWSAVSGAVSYNVRYKPTASSTWATASATATSVAVSSLTASTAYEFQVQTACSGSTTSGYSASVNFTTGSGGTSASYCTSKGSSAANEWIRQVQTGTINNTSGSNGGYGDYTSLSTNFVQGSTNPVTLVPDFSSGLLGKNAYPEYWRVWIDFNQDKDFDDAGELVFDAGATSSTTVNGSIAVPADALTGTTRMRVQMKYNAAGTTCETFPEGEVEDYSVNITASGAVTCNVPAGLSTSSINSTSATLNWTAVSGNTGYNVRYKPTASTTWINTSATTATLSISGLTAATAYEFQVQTICSPTSSSAFSASANFTTSSGTVSYCASKGNSTTNEWIKQVQIGTINNTTGANGGYADFTSQSTNLAPGSSTAITLTPGFATNVLTLSSSYPEYWKVYIDFNQDGDFLDAGELAYDAGATSNAAVHGNLVVPSTASLGATRMRVQMKYNAAPSSCETFAEGEVEDYTANITSAPFSRLAAPASKPAAASYVKLFPNPASDIATLSVQLKEASSLLIQAVDVAGRLVWEKQCGAQSAGETRISVNTKDWKEGIYFITVRTDGFNEVQRVSVVR